MTVWTIIKLIGPINNWGRDFFKQLARLLFLPQKRTKYQITKFDSQQEYCKKDSGLSTGHKICLLLQHKFLSNKFYENAILITYAQNMV